MLYVIINIAMYIIQFSNDVRRIEVQPKNAPNAKINVGKLF